MALGSFARIRHRYSGKYLVIGDAQEDDAGSLAPSAQDGNMSLHRGASKAGSRL